MIDWRLGRELKGLIVFISLMIASAQAEASEARCLIEIERLQYGSVEKFYTQFDFAESEYAGMKAGFSLPGFEFSDSCFFYFSNLHSGTMISCNLDELGLGYVQSDRTLVEERDPKNNLTFRTSSGLYTLRSKCSKNM